LACRGGVPLLEVDVSHRVRRGVSARGTMWRRRAHSPIPLPLVRFSATALRDSLSFRARISRADLEALELPRDAPSRAMRP
jgi:hypothetical protein